MTSIRVPRMARMSRCHATRVAVLGKNLGATRATRGMVLRHTLLRVAPRQNLWLTPLVLLHVMPCHTPPRAGLTKITANSRSEETVHVVQCVVGIVVSGI